MLGNMCVFSQDSIVNVNTGVKFLLNEVLLNDNLIHSMDRVECFKLKHRVLKVYPYVDTIKKIC